MSSTTTMARSSDWLAEEWERLDGELAQSLARRDRRRATLGRCPSPLDAVAADLSRARTALGLVAFAFTTADTASSEMRAGDMRCAMIVTRAFLWCLHVAREIESIESRGLDQNGDWTWFEAFAPNATASFHAAVGDVIERSKDKPVGGLVEAALDPILAHLDLALRASAWAA